MVLVMTENEMKQNVTLEISYNSVMIVSVVLHCISVSNQARGLVLFHHDICDTVFQTGCGWVSLGVAPPLTSQPA